MRRDLMDETGRLSGRLNVDDALIAMLRRGYAYALVLRRLYGVNVELDYPPILTVPDRDTGLDQHFRLQFDWRFVDVEVRRPSCRRCPMRCGSALHGGAHRDRARSERILPPERFVLRGFMILKAVDVTDQEVLSSLKRDLIDKDSIVSSRTSPSLQAKLRTLFRRPEPAPRPGRRATAIACSS